jgi:mxaJ protein
MSRRCGLRDLRPLALTGALCLLVAGTGATEDRAAAADTLRVCASESEAPFSMSDASGFENRLAQVLASEMGRTLVTVWTSKPAIYLVRDFLDKNQCDLVMGLDTGDERVLTTKPYYRTGYVIVTRADRNITTTKFNDPQFQKLHTVAVRFHSPGELILRQTGKYENTAIYLSSLVGFKSPRNQYLQIPAERLIQEVAEGRADAAIAFAPEVARYVKASRVPLSMRLITEPIVQPDGSKVELQFSQSMGVRKNDPRLKAALDAVIDRARAQLHKPLEAEGIPLLPTSS